MATSDNNNGESPETTADTGGSIENLSAGMPEFADWLPDVMLPWWETIAQYPLIGALVITAIFYLAAYVVRSVVLQAIGRGLARWKLHDALLVEFRGPLFTTIFYFGLTLAVKAADLPVGTAVIISLLLSVIVASWMRASLRISSRALQAMVSNRQRFTLVEHRTVPMFDLTVKLLVILVGSYVLLLIWGINPVGWLASAGIVGIAVGFAAKDTLANLFSGFFIVADAPYKIGDYINLDTGERGKITAIGMRSTRMLTRDDVEITVPNAVIANAKIINESGGPNTKMRVRVPVGVAYGSDVDQVCGILQAVGEEHENTCSNPAPRVRMRGFGASSLDFDLLVWIEEPETRGLIIHELLMETYKAFARDGIEIPYSKHDVFIKEMPGGEES